MHNRYFVKTALFSVSLVLLASYTTASPSSCKICERSQTCLPPACSCCSDHMPIGRTPDIPQMVFFTFDDAITSPVSDFYRNLFDSKRKNPNGCPIKMTLFVSHQHTKYTLVKEFYKKGMEIGAHSVTHSHLNESNFLEEAKVQKENIARMADIPISEIKGWRSPFLEPLGDTQPSVLKQLGYTYDATLTVDKEDPKKAPLPFTLDYGWPYDCKIKPCPRQNHSSFWEVPVVTLKDYKQQFSCVYVDGCNNPPPDEDMAFKFLWDNFRTYYEGNRAPFGINMHASWFYYADRLAGMERFIRELGKLSDAFIVSASQVIDWLKQPTPIQNIDTFEPWACAESRIIAVEKKRKLEAQRKALEEKKRLEAQRKVLEEKLQIEAQQKAVEEKLQIEAQRKALEQQHLLEAKQKALEDQRNAALQKKKRQNSLNDRKSEKSTHNANEATYNYLGSPMVGSSSSRMGTPIMLPSFRRRSFGIKFRKIDGFQNHRHQSRPSSPSMFSRISTAQKHKLSNSPKDESLGKKEASKSTKYELKGSVSKVKEIGSHSSLYGKNSVNDKVRALTESGDIQTSKQNSNLVEFRKVEKEKSRVNLENMKPTDNSSLFLTAEEKSRQQTRPNMQSSVPLIKVLQWLHKNMLLMQSGNSSSQRNIDSNNSTTNNTSSSLRRNAPANPKLIAWVSANKPLLSQVLVRLRAAIKHNNAKKYLPPKDSQHIKSDTSLSTSNSLFLEKLSTPKLNQVTTTPPYVAMEQWSTTTEEPVLMNNNELLGQQPSTSMVHSVTFSDLARSSTEGPITNTVTNSQSMSMSTPDPLDPIRQQIKMRVGDSQPLNAARIKNTESTIVRDSITNVFSDVLNPEVVNQELMTPDVVSDRAPGGLNSSQIPQMIYVTIESSVNFLTFSKIKSLFNQQRKNPNGCRIGGTVFVKTRRTSPRLLKSLHLSGLEIGVMVDAHLNSYQKDVTNNRENLSKRSSIPLSHIKGIRVHKNNIETTRNLSFLSNSSLYDASTILSNPSWPYTLTSKDKSNHSNHSIYEVPIIPITSVTSTNKCTYVDGCPLQPRTSDETFRMLMDNFADYYRGSRVPFGIHLQQTWFKWSNQHNLAGLSMFLDTVLRNKDVYVLSIQDMLKWVGNPTPLKSDRQFPDWKC